MGNQNSNQPVQKPGPSGAQSNLNAPTSGPVKNQQPKDDAADKSKSPSGSNKELATASKSKPKESETETDDSEMQDVVAYLLTTYLLDNYEMHLGVTCHTCEEKNFFGYRYKCLVCNDYDLCDDCFQTRRTSELHRSNHPMLIIANAIDRQRNVALQQIFESSSYNLLAKLEKQVFTGVNCNCCSVESITGIRLKCDDCCEFDLCWKCYKSGAASRKHDDGHSLIAHLWPTQTTFELDKVEPVGNREMNGCFGTVCKVRYEGEVRALKTIPPIKKIHVRMFLNELRAYQEIRCNYIVKFYGRSVQEDPVKLCILMEFMQGGSLKEAIESNCDLSIRRKLYMLTSVAKGLRCIHKKGFVHKDIKPDNILLNGRGNVKIGDMGTAIHDDGKNYFRDPVAPYCYAAPEIFSGDKFTNKVDMFSFGLLMNELLTYIPYEGETTDTPIRFAVKTKVLWPLVQSCVRADPDERPTAVEAVEQLEMFDQGFWWSLDSPEVYVNSDTKVKDHLMREYSSLLQPDSHPDSDAD